MDIVQSATVKAKGALDLGSNTDYDTILAQLITSVSKAFERLAGWGVEKKARAEYHDTDSNTMRIRVHGWPIDSGEDVAIYYDPTWNFESETEVDSSYYNINYDTGEIHFLPGLFSGYYQRVLKITYTGGGAATASAFEGAYEDVARAVIEQIAFEFNRMKDISDQSTRVGDMTVSKRDPKYLPLFAQTVAAYQRRII